MAAFAALFGMTFTSCSNDDEAIASGSNDKMETKSIIGFNVVENGSTGTRGVPVTSAGAPGSAVLSNFQVWAFDAAGDVYMGSTATSTYDEGDDAECTGYKVFWDTSLDTPAFNYSPTKYWPTSNLSFVAISPFLDAEVTTVHASASTTVSTVEANVSVPTTVANQHDIMMAGCASRGAGAEVGSDATDVSLAFNHVLSQVRFAANIAYASNITKVDIDEITIKKIEPAATISYPSTGTTAANVTVTLPSPATAWASKAAYSAVIADGEITTKVDGNGTFEDVTSDANQLMLIPQSVVGTGAASTLAEATASATDTKVYLKVCADVWQGTTKILAKETPVYIPMPAEGTGSTWAAGNIYTYRLTFTESLLQPIVFATPTVTAWTGPTNAGLSF